MTFNEWLDAKTGRLSAVADHFGITPSAVCQWRDNGVPVKHIPALQAFIGRAVSLRELVERPYRADA